jgi:phosphoglycolate phosphatase-like HAD superfamily hydrolase
MIASGLRSLVFDCDGVILDSNRIKTEAFRRVASEFCGDKYADCLVEFHLNNGGLSRQVKFRFLLDLLPKGREWPSLNELCERFSEEVREALLTAPVAHGLGQWRSRFPELKWAVVSGGNQEELRDIFCRRELADHFDGGIWGSPTPKTALLKAAVEAGSIELPAIYFGDSRLDYFAARDSGLEFLFISDWTEFAGWEEFCCQMNISSFCNIGSALEWLAQNVRSDARPIPLIGRRNSP